MHPLLEKHKLQNMCVSLFGTLLKKVLIITTIRVNPTSPTAPTSHHPSLMSFQCIMVLRTAYYPETCSFFSPFKELPLLLLALWLTTNLNGHLLDWIYMNSRLT